MYCLTMSSSWFCFLPETGNKTKIMPRLRTQKQMGLQCEPIPAEEPWNALSQSLSGYWYFLNTIFIRVWVLGGRCHVVIMTQLRKVTKWRNTETQTQITELCTTECSSNFIRTFYSSSYKGSLQNKFDIFNRIRRLPELMTMLLTLTRLLWNKWNLPLYSYWRF